MAITNTEWGNIVHLNAYMGELWTVEFVVRGVDGSPIPVNTANVIKLQMKLDPKQSYADFEAWWKKDNTSDSLLIAGSDSNCVQIKKKMSVSKAGIYYYDLFIDDVDTPYYPYKGTVKVTQNVSR